MIIVTGGAGFIGSNLIKALNEQGHNDILLVDEMTDGHKFENFSESAINDYIDKDDFLTMIKTNVDMPSHVQAIFHLGACSDTTEWDGRYMLKNNYEYSKALFNYCIEQHIPFIYASSAAVYGGSNVFREDPTCERPLNVYGFSKLLFDRYVRNHMSSARSQVVGLRYFNVYGPREQHKGTMASMAFHLNNQLKEQGKLKLFEGTEGYGNGEQLRDFVYIDDVVAVKTWLLKTPDVSGIFNVGTGKSQTFNDVANSVINWHGKGELEYIPFPDHLKGFYQSFTEADIYQLREAGYTGQFRSVEEGVKHYLDWMHAEADK